MSAETQRRWRVRLGLSQKSLKKLLAMLVADDQTRRLYRQEVTAMIEREPPICFRQQHLFYARPIQLASISGLYTTQFTAWFNTPGLLPSRTTRKLLSTALGMTEEELVSAFHDRQQYVVTVKHERCLIDRHLSKRSW